MREDGDASVLVFVKLETANACWRGRLVKHPVLAKGCRRARSMYLGMGRASLMSSTNGSGRNMSPKQALRED